MANRKLWQKKQWITKQNTKKEIIKQHGTTKFGGRGQGSQITLLQKYVQLPLWYRQRYSVHIHEGNKLNNTFNLYRNNWRKDATRTKISFDCHKNNMETWTGTNILACLRILNWYTDVKCHIIDFLPGSVIFRLNFVMVPTVWNCVFLIVTLFQTLHQYTVQHDSKITKQQHKKCKIVIKVSLFLSCFHYMYFTPFLCIGFHSATLDINCH